MLKKITISRKVYEGGNEDYTQMIRVYPDMEKTIFEIIKDSKHFKDSKVNLLNERNETIEMPKDLEELTTFLTLNVKVLTISHDIVMKDSANEKSHLVIYTAII